MKISAGEKILKSNHRKRQAINSINNLWQWRRNVKAKARNKLAMKQSKYRGGGGESKRGWRRGSISHTRMADVIRVAARQQRGKMTLAALKAKNKPHAKQGDVAAAADMAAGAKRRSGT